MFGLPTNYINLGFVGGGALGEMSGLVAAAGVAVEVAVAPEGLALGR